jgi:hypothetical protein
VRLTGPRRIDECAVIEFANLHVDARVVHRHSASVSTEVGRCSSVDWKEGSEAEAALLFGQADSQERISKSSQSVSHGEILTAPVQSFLSPPTRLRDQVTQTMSQSSFRGAPPRPRRKATQPQTGLSRELRVDSNQSSALSPVLPATSTDSRNAPVPLLGHDTVVMPPFWIRESEPKECEASDGNADSGAGAQGAGPQPKGISKRKAATMRGVEWHGLELLHRFDSGDSEEALKAPVASTTLHRPSIAPQNWVARLGLMATRRPLLVWLVGAALAFVLAGLAALVGKQLPHLH